MLPEQGDGGVSAEESPKTLDVNGKEDTLAPVPITASDSLETVISSSDGEHTAVDRDRGGNCATKDTHDSSDIVISNAHPLGPVQVRKVRRNITTGKTTIEFIEDDSPSIRRRGSESYLPARRRHGIEDGLPARRRRSIEDDSPAIRRRGSEGYLPARRRHGIEDGLPARRRRSIEDDSPAIRRRGSEGYLPARRRHGSYYGSRRLIDDRWRLHSDFTHSTDGSASVSIDEDTSTDGSLHVNVQEPRGPKTYVTKPSYVLELRDAYGKVVRRRESTKPYERDKPYRSGNPHVLQIVHVIQNDSTRGLSRSAMNMMIETAPISTTELKVLSPLLVRAMHDVITYYPDRNPYGPMILQHHFSLLVHHTKELEAYKATNDSALSPEDVQERNKHIDCALKLVHTVHGEDIFVSEAGQEQTPPVTTFKNYWMLLKSGALVYKRQYGVLSTYIVHSVTGGVENQELKPYRIILWNLNFDGRRLGRCTEEEFLMPFEGERPIGSLSVYPVDFHQDKEGTTTMREQMVARGRKFMSLTKPTYCNYDGHTLSSPIRPYNGRVMVDTAMRPWEDSSDSGFYTIRRPWRDTVHPEFTPILADDPTKRDEWRASRRPHSPGEDVGPAIKSVQSYANYDYLTIDSDLTEEQLLLCSYYVHGYLMKNRKWEVIYVEMISFREYDTDLMDKLVISDENKHMIKAICRNYTRGRSVKMHKEWSADIIEGKGEGQIFLLHGRPGVGKTLTAECVAEYTQRPLLAITPGDIGTSPYDVERELNKFFRLGEQWGTILLLDEADVYLESRNNRDLVRNSLVSVFLRALEYYQGILFLTTNRVGSFDEAFASRIHVSIHYGDLGEEGRQVIWDNLFNDLERDRPEVLIEYSARGYVSGDAVLQSLEWNGRQIRNAFSTAVTLAEYEAAEAKPVKVPCKFCKSEDHTHENCVVKHPEKRGKMIFLKYQHLKSVTEMSSRFKEYLKSTKNADESKLAKLRNLRDDDFRDDEAKNGTMLSTTNNGFG